MVYLKFHYLFIVTKNKIVELMTGQYHHLIHDDNYPTTLKTDYIELKLLPEFSMMQDLKNTFKSKSKKPVENYEVKGIQITGLSLDEKEVYPVTMRSVIPVDEGFNPTLLLLAADSMTEIQRYLKNYEPKETGSN